MRSNIFKSKTIFLHLKRVLCPIIFTKQADVPVGGTALQIFFRGCCDVTVMSDCGIKRERGHLDLPPPIGSEIRSGTEAAKKIYYLHHLSGQGEEFSLAWPWRTTACIKQSVLIQACGKDAPSKFPFGGWWLKGALGADLWLSGDVHIGLGAPGDPERQLKERAGEMM